MPALVLGTINAAIPFTLIAWGETHIDSGVAAIANATVPLFVVLLAIKVRPSERATGARLAGILLGLAGVVLLAGAQPGGGWWAVAGTLAVVLASLSYACGALYGQARSGELAGPCSPPAPSSARRSCSPRSPRAGAPCHAGLEGDRVDPRARHRRHRVRAAGAVPDVPALRRLADDARDLPDAACGAVYGAVFLERAADARLRRRPRDHPCRRRARLRRRLLGRRRAAAAPRDRGSAAPSRGDVDFLVELFSHEEVDPFLAAVRVRDADGVRAEIERSQAEPEDFGAS